MSTDGYFRPLSSAALALIAQRPALADRLKRFDPWFRADDPESGWPAHVRGMYAWLQAAGERDPEEARELAAEMSLVNFWGPVEPEEVRALCATGLSLDDAPPSVQVCGAGWAELHLLVTGRPWRQGMPLARALGRREVGSDARHGATRLLDPAEVAAAAARLSSVGLDEMAARYDAVGSADGFSAGWEELRGEWSKSFGEVCDQYVDARARGHGMMVYVA